MLRGNRLFILAVAGLALVGAGQPPKGQSQAEPTKEQREISQSLKDIAASLEESDKPNEAEKPCPKEQENRNSDLCAQWKAAHAAADAAEASWYQFRLGVGGLIVGFLTLVAAGVAAYFAKKAADYMIAGQRAWLRAEITPIMISHSEIGDIDIWIEITIRNMGGMVANGLEARILATPQSPNGEAERPYKTIDGAVNAIPPGGSEMVRVHASFPSAEIKLSESWNRYRAVVSIAITYDQGCETIETWLIGERRDASNPDRPWEIVLTNQLTESQIAHCPHTGRKYT
jgi:hypothetical protein